MASFKDRLIIGRQPLLEAIAAGTTIDKILLQKTSNGEVSAQIRQLCKDHQIPMQLVPVEKLNSFTRANHQGIIAFAAMVNYLSLQDIITITLHKNEVPLFLMLDNITDVRNIGAIARTAYCCGVQTLIIPDKGVGSLNEEAMKSSAGALEHLKICRVTSLMKAVDELHQNGIQVFASEMKAATTLSSIDFNQPCCIVMGGEEKGVYPPLLKICDDIFNIPMTRNFESLNVSVASGMILYETMKQRGS